MRRVFGVRTKWSLLYRMLWRLTHGEPRLLEVESMMMCIALSTDAEKSVRRDMHKMKAFVRFRRVDGDGAAEEELCCMASAGPFDREGWWRRFSCGSVWRDAVDDHDAGCDGAIGTLWFGSCRFGPGVPVTAAPQDDVLEEFVEDVLRVHF